MPIIAPTKHNKSIAFHFLHTVKYNFRNVETNMNFLNEFCVAVKAPS